MSFFCFSSRRRHTRCYRDWSSDVCSSDLSANGSIPRDNCASARSPVPRAARTEIGRASGRERGEISGVAGSLKKKKKNLQERDGDLLAHVQCLKQRLVPGGRPEWNKVEGSVKKLCFDKIILLHDFFFSSRRRHTRCYRDWSSDVCSSDLMIRHTRCYRDWSSDVCSSDLRPHGARSVWRIAGGPRA